MRRLAIALMGVLLLPGVTLAEDMLVTAEAMKEVELSGYTREHKSMKVIPEVSGKVLKVNYDIGDTLGDKPFVEVDTTFIDLNIDSTEKAIARLEVELERADSRVEFLEKEFGRVDKLYKEDRATEVRLDAAKQELDQGVLARDSMRLELEGLRTKLAELGEQRERHYIHLPQGWALTGRGVEEGEVVQPGVPIATASDFRKLVVPLSVTAEELEAIKEMPREFEATLEGEAVKARLNWVNPEFDERTRKRSIEIIITKYAGPRTGGLRFMLPVSVRAEGVLVPRAAVTERYKNPRVRLADTGEVVHIIVTGELDENVIAAPDPRLKPGTGLIPPK